MLPTEKKLYDYREFSKPAVGQRRSGVFWLAAVAFVLAIITATATTTTSFLLARRCHSLEQRIEFLESEREQPAINSDGRREMKLTRSGPGKERLRQSSAAAKTKWVAGAVAAHFASGLNGDSFTTYRNFANFTDAKYVYNVFRPVDWMVNRPSLAAATLESNSFAVIKENGLYLVYAQVEHKNRNPISASAHSVFADRQTLLECAIMSNVTRPQACYTSGVFELQAGARVSVRQTMYDPNIVEYRDIYLAPGRTFFGMIKIADL